MSRVQKPSKTLTDQCQYLKGVGPSRAERLRQLGVETVSDLLTHFPRDYYDRRKLIQVAEIPLGEQVNFRATVLSVAQPRSWGRSKPRSTAALGDDTGVIQAVWFNQPYLARHLKPGTQVLVTGVMSYFRKTRQLVNPEFETIVDDEATTPPIVPIYPLTAGVSQRYLRELIIRTLDQYQELIYENLPAELCDDAGLCERGAAIRGIHFPEDDEHHEAAKRRLKIEELFYLQLILSLQRARQHKKKRPAFAKTTKLRDKFIDRLPFDLTTAQQRVLGEIGDDLKSSAGMHRLLQGDVGSGKTVVAAAAMLAAAESGFQAALMVPTEILAIQHGRTLAAYLDPLGVRVSLLIGSLKAADKRAVQAQIADGSCAIAVGTHALIQDEVRFDRLGLVVIDEQHRFGVRQRAALLSRGVDPHVFVMTATPIPRTLALTAYADLDLSVIDELPAGRLPVKTAIVTPGKRPSMYDYIRREVEEGRRAFLLYPVIEETEKQDLEAAVSAYEELSNGVFADVPTGLLHGRMNFAEKELVMRDFSSGQVKVLVTTTVVEVGVDVPEATIMVIHHPERFGLSQLHQLRGRVGRGRDQGYCFLAVTEETSQIARDRLKILTQFSDGFRIAEEDLKLRGPGEFLGVRQHGAPGFKLANPAVDQKLVELSQRHVKALLAVDASLKGPDSSPCRRFLADAYSGILDQMMG